MFICFCMNALCSKSALLITYFSPVYVGHVSPWHLPAVKNEVTSSLLLNVTFVEGIMDHSIQCDDEQKQKSGIKREREQQTSGHVTNTMNPSVCPCVIHHSLTLFLCRYAQIECGLYFKLKALKQSELGVMICFHIFHFYSQKSTFLCLTLKLTGIFFVNTAHTLTKCSFPAETMIYPVTCSELRGGYFNPPPCTLRACHSFIYFIKYTQITIEKLCF